MALYNIILSQQPKVFDVTVNDNKLSFDIVTRGQTTACDLIVHQLVYNTTISASSAFVLDCCLTNYLLRKQIALKKNEIELAAHLDNMIKLCSLSIDSTGELYANTEIISKCFNSTDASLMRLSADLDGLFYKIYMQIESSQILDVSADMFISTSVGEIASNILLSSSVGDVISQKMFFVKSDVSLLSSANTSAQKTIGSISNEMSLYVDVIATIGHYHTLRDLDGEESSRNALSVFDNTPLAAMSFIDK